MKRMYSNIGQFELRSGIIRVSDPGYNKDVWCTGTIENCKIGVWDAAVARIDAGQLGVRNTMLVASHQDSQVTAILADGIDPSGITSQGSGLRACDFEVGVDSGQAGIFDDELYGLDDVFKKIADKNCNPPQHYGSVWFDYCCAATDSSLQANVIPCGAVSSSGYGDGCYTAYCHTDKDGKVDFVAIYFYVEDDG